MSETVAALLPILNVVGAGGGAGILAGILISWLRTRYPVPTSAPSSALARFGLALIHAPRYTRYTAMILAALIALPFATLAAYFQHQPVLPVIDALIAALISQVYHGVIDKATSVPYGVPDQAVVDRLSDVGSAVGNTISGTCQTTPMPTPILWSLRDDGIAWKPLPTHSDIKVAGTFIGPDIRQVKASDEAPQETPNNGQTTPDAAPGA